MLKPRGDVVEYALRAAPCPRGGEMNAGAAHIQRSTLAQHMSSRQICTNWAVEVVPAHRTEGTRIVEAARRLRCIRRASPLGCAGVYGRGMSSGPEPDQHLEPMTARTSPVRMLKPRASLAPPATRTGSPVRTDPWRGTDFSSWTGPTPTGHRRKSAERHQGSRAPECWCRPTPFYDDAA